MATKEKKSFRSLEAKMNKEILIQRLKYLRSATADV